MSKISDNDKVEKNNGFTKKLTSELKSRLHARFVQYEVFTFNAKIASVVLHLTNSSVTVKLPYIIERGRGEDDYTLYFRSNEVVGSLSGLMSFLLSTMRKEESKLSKFKSSK